MDPIPRRWRIELLVVLPAEQDDGPVFENVEHDALAEPGQLRPIPAVSSMLFLLSDPAISSLRSSDSRTVPSVSQRTDSQTSQIPEILQGLAVSERIMLPTLPMVSLLLYMCFASYCTNAGGSSDTGLQHNFYALSCPQAEDVARRTLMRNRMSDPTSPAALLRVVFHDCQVEGCDASILLDSSSSMTAETVSEKNFAIRRLDYIDNIKAAIEKECPSIVSCADIIVMAARDAIAMSGGPRISIETGRRDTLFASNLNADHALPPATITVSAMLDTLAEKGLDIEESVAILGAHTLGVGHCLNFINRFDPQDSGPQMSPFFSTALRVLCQAPPSVSNTTFAPNDLTNFMFDNQYFRDIQAQRGLLTVDAEMALDPRTKKYVDLFAINQLLFFAKFSDAFVKLTRFNVLTGSDGEIRTNCRAVN